MIAATHPAVTHYRSVFDIATAEYTNWRFPAAGGLMSAGLTLVAWELIKSSSPRQITTVFITLMGVISAVWTVVAFAMTFKEYHILTKKIAEGGGTAVEGSVNALSPASRNTPFSPQTTSGR